jgi:hypothetical protein
VACVVWTVALLEKVKAETNDVFTVNLHTVNKEDSASALDPIKAAIQASKEGVRVYLTPFFYLQFNFIFSTALSCCCHEV